MGEIGCLVVVSFAPEVASPVVVDVVLVVVGRVLCSVLIMILDSSSHEF